VTLRILGISGSLQAQSSNRALVQAASRLVPAGVEFVVSDHLRGLPHFDPDLETPEPPASVREWRRAVEGADAVLIACPEYGHSLPGSLKNGIDWLIGSGELERKVVAITAAVKSADRGQRGLQALAGTLAAVSARLVGGEPTLVDATFDSAVAHLLHTLVERVEQARSEDAV
jgi:chromate reductase, NAD(P)H dehydrogenase (quinone)